MIMETNDLCLKVMHSIYIYDSQSECGDLGAISGLK